MPIYEYRCESCGFQKEFMQKVSDAPLVECPQCKQATFKKLLSAAGFQLKGSGWYATDFKNKTTKPTASKESDKSATKSDGKSKEGGDSSSSSSSDTKTDSSSDTKSTKSACSAGPCPACS